MDLGIAGKRALVLGGSDGLGRAIAEELLGEGVQVVIVARNSARLDSVAKEIGAVGLVGDVSIAGKSRELVALASDALGGSPDILVTNTGGPKAGTFQTLHEDAWRGGFDNLWMSVVESMQAVLPGMRERQWGRILAVTSIAAKEPQPGLLISNALRAGLLGLVNSVSREVAGDGVTINALLPGYTKTARITELGIDDATMGSKIPAGRLGRPQEFAALAAFLASKRASYITGQAIAVDGGFLNSI